MQTNWSNGFWNDVDHTFVRSANDDRVAEPSSAPIRDVDPNEKLGRRTWQADDIISAVANCVGDCRRRRRFAQNDHRRVGSAAPPRLVHTSEGRATASCVDENDVGIDVGEEREIRVVAIPRQGGELSVAQEKTQRRTRVGVSEKHGAWRSILHLQVIRDAGLHARREGHLKQGTRQVKERLRRCLPTVRREDGGALRLANVFVRGRARELLSIYMTVFRNQERHFENSDESFCTMD